MIFEVDGGEMQAALAQWTGQTTVPNVFIGGKHVGGCDCKCIYSCLFHVYCNMTSKIDPSIHPNLVVFQIVIYFFGSYSCYGEAQCRSACAPSH